MDPKTLVETYLDALLAYDYRAARFCLADRGFHYVSPLGELDSAEALINQSFLTSGIISRYEIRKAFVDGPDVCHVLLFHVQISEKQQVPLVQWAHVHDARIQRLEVFFDAHPYRTLFPEAP